MKLFIISSILLITSACTWVELNDRGKNVVLATSGDVLSCKKIGNVTAKTRSNIISDAPRDVEKVALELSILARNEAAKIDANTIVPSQAPINGSQLFNAYYCPAK
jgi:hypothetical protein